MEAPPVNHTESGPARPEKSSTPSPRSWASQGRATQVTKETVGSVPADERSRRSSGHGATPLGGAADPATPAPAPPPKTTNSPPDSSRADAQKSSGTSPAAPSPQLKGASPSTNPAPGRTPDSTNSRQTPPQAPSATPRASATPGVVQPVPTPSAAPDKRSGTAAPFGHS